MIRIKDNKTISRISIVYIKTFYDKIQYLLKSKIKFIAIKLGLSLSVGRSSPANIPKNDMI